MTINGRILSAKKLKNKVFFLFKMDNLLLDNKIINKLVRKQKINFKRNTFSNEIIV